MPDLIGSARDEHRHEMTIIRLAAAIAPVPRARLWHLAKHGRYHRILPLGSDLRMRNFLT